MADYENVRNTTVNLLLFFYFNKNFTKLYKIIQNFPKILTEFRNKYIILLNILVHRSIHKSKHYCEIITFGNLILKVKNDTNKKQEVCMRKFKKLLIVMMMSLIVIGVLSVTSYAAVTASNLPYTLISSPASTSGYDGTVVYSDGNFQSAASYSNVSFTSQGTVTVPANTDRGNTSGGYVDATIQELVAGFIWWNHYTEAALGSKVVILDVPSQRTYTYSSSYDSSVGDGLHRDGKCSLTKDCYYRARFEILTICAPSTAGTITVSPRSTLKSA